MLEILKAIDRILFLPITISSLTGIGILFIFRKKLPQAGKWIRLMITLVVIIGFLAVFQIGSSRYASILIFPALLFIAALLYYIPLFVRKYVSGATWISVIIFIVLYICCIGKNLHFSFHSSYPIAAGNAIKADIAAHSNLPAIVIGPRASSPRICYYAKISKAFQRFWEREWDTPDITRAERIEMIRRIGFDSGTIYIINPESKKENIISAADLGVSEEQWRPIFRQKTNRRGTKFLSIYRYFPTKVNTRQDLKTNWKNNVIWQQDFESSSLRTAEDWGWKRDNYPEHSQKNIMEITRDFPISGKQSLHLACDLRLAVYLSRRFTARPARLYLRVRHPKNMGGWGIKLFLYKHGKRIANQLITNNFSMNNEVVVYCFDIDRAMLNDADQYTLSIFVNNGSMVIDDIFLIKKE